MDRWAFIGTMAALLHGSGCAGPDRINRIDRMGATVDVTGLWEGLPSPQSVTARSSSASNRRARGSRGPFETTGP